MRKYTTVELSLILSVPEGYTSGDGCPVCSGDVRRPGVMRCPRMTDDPDRRLRALERDGRA